MLTLKTKPGGSSSDFDDLHHALQEAASEVRGTMRRTAIFTAIWRWLALLGIAFSLDLAFGLAAGFRWVIMVGLVAFAVYSVFQILREQRAFRRSDEWAARAVEERFPDADNALINGIQFERILSSGNPDEREAELMRLEIDRARRTTEKMGGAASVVDRGPERKAAKSMAIALGVWLLIAIFFTGGFMAVMPRLFAPWMDDTTPPWSATKFDVQPKGASVRFGDSVDISVDVTGLAPNDVSLMVRQRGHSDWERLEMTADEAGHYDARLDSLSSDTQYYIQANTGRSARYWITVAQPPQVTDVQATYTLPKYTGRPPFSEIVGADGIHGLQGTIVFLQVSTNRALSSGVIHVLTQGASGQLDETVSLAPLKSAATEGTGQFVIDRPGEFRIDLTASDGQSSVSAAHGKIVLDTSQRPNVWIPQPGRNLLVTPSMTIPLRIEAQSENALASVTLHRTINDLDDSPVGYPVAGLPKSLTEPSSFDLPDLGVQAGDVIKYYAEASDNQPGTPNIGVSETYTITVVTPEQFQKALQQERTPLTMKSESEDMLAATQRLAQEQRELAQQMRNVANQLAKKPGDKALTQQMKALADQQKQLQDRASKLAQQMKQYAQSPSGSDFERALKAKVAQAAEKIASAAEIDAECGKFRQSNRAGGVGGKSSPADVGGERASPKASSEGGRTAHENVAALQRC